MTKEAIRKKLDELPRYRPVVDGIGRPTMSMHLAQWDVDCLGWLNVEAVYSLLEGLESQERPNSTCA